MRPPTAIKDKQGGNDAAVVLYPDIRDRFLSKLPNERESRLESYVEIGRFIVDRWMAEEHFRKDGEPLNEKLTWQVWDQLTEKQLRDLRFEALYLLRKEMTEHRLRTFIADWREKLQPWQLFTHACGWHWKHVWGHIVGAIGLIFLASLLAHFVPSIVRDAWAPVSEAIHKPVG